MIPFRQHIILLALIESPLHGYDIQQASIGLSGGMLVIPLTSIYRGLNVLTQTGHIEPIGVKPAKGHKQAYRITRRGEAELLMAANTYGDFAARARQQLR
jgi:DNA-binding PadR family transcriptional regulator